MGRHSTKATVCPMSYKCIFMVKQVLCAIVSCCHSGDVLQLVRISFKLVLFYARRNIYLESLRFFHNSVITLHWLLHGTCSCSSAPQNVVRKHHHDSHEATRLLSMLQISLKRKSSFTLPVLCNYSNEPHDYKKSIYLLLHKLLHIPN